MIILNGKEVSKEVLANISEEIEKIKNNNKRIPRLDVILVGDDFASIKYVEMKRKVAEEVGIDVNIHHFGDDVTTDEIINLIEELNSNNSVDGIMVQLPLPKHIENLEVLDSIATDKDVDGLTPTNLGKLFQRDESAILSATPLGIIELLEHYNIDVAGKNVVILGASEIVGKPLSAILLNKHATVTLCNSYTSNIKKITSCADILVSAIGKPLFVTSDFIKDGCVVVDVGSNKHPITGKLVGDVDFDNVKDKCSYITPVPGGVGPMTIASLMLNLIHSYNARHSN